MLLRLKNITKEYGSSDNKITALDDITVSIEKGEAIGITGPSGSGKSTLLKILNLVEEPTSGSLSFLNEETSQLKSKQKRLLQQEMSMVFQHFNLLHNRTVLENIVLPLKWQKSQKMSATELDALLKFVNIAHKKEAYPRDLSGGEKQRVAIARALVTQPKLLLCDEPTSALDEHHKQEVLSLLKKVQSEYQTTLVMISHDFEAIRVLCDKAYILEQGRMIDCLTVNHDEKEKAPISFHERAKEALQR